MMVMSPGVIQKLLKLGFTQKEARLYSHFLFFGPDNASHAARHLGIAKSTSYAAADKLAQRGLVELIPGVPNLYSAVTPKQAFTILAEEYSTTADILGSILKSHPLNANSLHVKACREPHLINRRIQRMIKSAKQSVFIWGNHHIELFYPLLSMAARRGIEVFVICCGGNRRLHCGRFQRNEDLPDPLALRLMIIRDSSEALVEDGVAPWAVQALYSSSRNYVDCCYAFFQAQAVGT